MHEVLTSGTKFKEMYHRMYPLMVNFAFGKTKDMELSQELVQITFVKLWNSRNSIEINSSIENYLYSMVRNNIIDNLRKNGKFVQLKEAGDINNLMIEENQNNEDEEIELKYNLKKAISSLKDKRRKIFELNKFEGLTYQEIADYLRISERVVEDNISKALKEIKTYFVENNLL